MTEVDLYNELDKFDPKTIQPMADIYDEYSYEFRHFLKFIERVRDDYEHQCELLSYCDQAREDIVHYLEFNSTNASERAKLTSKLIAIQKTRRAVKTRIECMQTIQDSWLNAQYLNTHRGITSILTRLSAMENRHYENRTPVISDTLGGANDGT